MMVKFLLDYSTRPLQFSGCWDCSARARHGDRRVRHFQETFLSHRGNDRARAAVAAFSGATGQRHPIYFDGLLGEIMARTYYESQSKPIYTLREVKSHRKEMATPRSPRGHPEIPSVNAPPSAASGPFLRHYFHPTLDQRQYSARRTIVNREQFYAMMNGEGTLDYEVYLRTKTLLSCQTDYPELCNRDELQFQLVHQVEELWMKLIAYTLLDIDKYLQQENTNRVLTLFDAFTASSE